MRKPIWRLCRTMRISISAILHFQFCLPAIKDITQYFNITVRTADFKIKTKKLLCVLELCQTLARRKTTTNVAANCCYKSTLQSSVSIVKMTFYFYWNCLVGPVRHLLNLIKRKTFARCFHIQNYFRLLWALK